MGVTLALNKGDTWISGFIFASWFLVGTNGI